MNLLVTNLINKLRDLLRLIPDSRTDSNDQYPFDDIAPAEFSVFRA